MDDLFDSELAPYFNTDAEFESIDKNELVRKLEDASYLEEMKTSNSWKLFMEAWKRIYKQAEIQLDNMDPANTARIIEAQLTKRFYRDVLSTTIRKVKEDGKAAYEQAKERGWLSSLFAHLKKDI